MGAKRMLIKGLMKDVRTGRIDNVRDAAANVQYIQSQLGAIHGNLGTTQGGQAQSLTAAQAHSLTAMRRLAQRTGKLERKSLRGMEAFSRNSFGTALSGVTKAQFAPAHAELAASKLGVKGLVKAGVLSAKGGKLAMQELRAGVSDASSAAAKERAMIVADAAAREKAQEMARTEAERMAQMQHDWDMEMALQQHEWDLELADPTKDDPMPGIRALTMDAPVIATNVQDAMVALRQNGTVTIGEQTFTTAEGYDPANLATAIAADMGAREDMIPFIQKAIFYVQQGKDTPTALINAAEYTWGDQPGYKSKRFEAALLKGIDYERAVTNAAAGGSADPGADLSTNQAVITKVGLLRQGVSIEDIDARLRALGFSEATIAATHPNTPGIGG